MTWWSRMEAQFATRFLETIDSLFEWFDSPDAKGRFARLWSGFGFIAVLALIGASACALYYLPSWYVNESVCP